MNFFSTYLGKLTSTFFISMVPVIELRGAIPSGIAMGLDAWTVAILAIIGNMLPIPFIILFIRKIFAWMRTKNRWFNSIVTKMEAKADKHKDKIIKYEFWGLCLLVAIPLPGTGGWTGALVAAMLDMRLKNAIPAIFLGIVIAAVVVSLVSSGVLLLFF